MKLQSFQNGQAILSHLEQGEIDIAFQKAKLLVTDEPDNALIHYSLALCFLEKNDENKAMEHFNKTLALDPSFVSAAEHLIEINKDGYSLGELKYLYTLITSHKEGTEEMYRFLDQFSTTGINTQLSTSKITTRQGNTKVADDDIYIKHLITQMDKYDKDAPKPDGEACNIPQPLTPPPHQAVFTQPEPTPAPTPVPEPVVSTPAATPSPFTAPEPAAAPKPVSTPKPEPAKESTTLQENSGAFGIETLTMAKLYIRQGLYEQAMAILMKLMKRNPNDENIQIEIDNLQVLMREKR